MCILISCKVFKLERNRSWNNDTNRIIFTLKVLSPKKTFLYGMSKKDGSLSASFWKRQFQKSRSHMITRLAIWSTLINMLTNRISFKGKGDEKEAHHTVWRLGTYTKGICRPLRIKTMIGSGKPSRFAVLVPLTSLCFIPDFSLVFIF